MSEEKPLVPKPEELTEAQRQLASAIASGIYYGLVGTMLWVEETNYGKPRKRRKVTTQRQKGSSLAAPKPWYPEYELPKREAGNDL